MTFSYQRAACGHHIRKVLTILIEKQTTLVATLGGQPQVVTFALDALLARQIPITELIVLHFAPSSTRLQTALATLAREFSEGPYGGIRFRPYPIQSTSHRLDDIRDEIDANATWDVVNQLLIDLKNNHHNLHICISGGRRILGLLTMSAAMLHFGHQDVLWHMYTPDEWQQQSRGGAMMHLPSDSGFQLIRVPMMPWGSYFPALKQLIRPNEADVLAGPRAALDHAEKARCQAVIDQLTDRQREVLFAFADGLNPQLVAEKLVITIKTVDSHKTAILAECRNAWALPDEEWLDYRFIADKFEKFPQTG